MEYIGESNLNPLESGFNFIIAIGLYTSHRIE